MLKKGIRAVKDLNKRVKVAIVATGVANFGSRMATRYYPLYAADLGASPINIGVLNSISQAFSSLFAIPMGWAVENYSVKKVMLFNITLFAVHLTIMGLAGHWWMLIPAYVISTRLLRMGALADIIFVTAAEPQHRGTIISLSRVVWNVLNVFAPMIAAIIVTAFGGINAPGIRPLFYLELALLIAVFLFVARYLPPTLGRVDIKATPGGKRTSLVRDYLNIAKGEKHLKRWIVLRLIQTFGTNLVNPFVSLWLVNVKGATPYTLGILGSTSLIVSLVLQLPAGRLADKFGRRKIYFAFRPISYLGTSLAILAQSPELLIVSGLLGGVAAMGGGGNAGISGVAQPLFVTWWWESVPEEKRGRFFGVEGLFSLVAIPASILGGILWQQGYVLHVLLLPILLEVIAVLPLLATVPDIIRSKQ